MQLGLYMLSRQSSSLKALEDVNLQAILSMKIAKN
jgi:hypothetical protein